MRQGSIKESRAKGYSERPPSALWRSCVCSSLAYWRPFLPIRIGGTLAKTLFSQEIYLAIRLSVITATIATAISVLIGIPAAYAISQTDFRGKAVVDTILDLPIVVSPVALGAALLVFFNNPVGVGIE